MSEILDGLPVAVNLMDDVLVFGYSEAQHNERLKKILDRIAESNVAMNTVKCVSSVNEVSFLGHLLSAEG